MNNPIRFTIVLGLAAAGLALAASEVMPQSKSEAAAVREAIQFQRAKDSADRRQLGTEAARPGQASEANRSEADRWTADRLTEPPHSDGAAVNEAIRFERLKGGAAARQMRLDARPSAVAAKTTNTKQ
jgi:hypothetical protein